MRLSTCCTILLTVLFAPVTLFAGETILKVPEGHVVELDCPQGSTRTIDPHETGPVRAPEACDRRVVEKPSDEKSEPASEKKEEGKSEPGTSEKSGSDKGKQDSEPKKGSDSEKSESEPKKDDDSEGESKSEQEPSSKNDESESDEKDTESRSASEKLAANPFPEIDLSGKAAAGGQAAFLGCLGYREDLSSAVFGRVEGCFGASPRSEAFLWGGQLQVGSPISRTFELGGFVDYTHSEAGLEGFVLSGGSFIGLRYHDWLPVDIYAGPGVVRNSSGWAPTGTVGIRLGFSPFHGKK